MHFNDAFMGTVSLHDLFTGILAAAYGGTASVIDFSSQWPGGETTGEVFISEVEGDVTGIFILVFEPLTRLGGVLQIKMRTGGNTV